MLKNVIIKGYAPLVVNNTSYLDEWDEYKESIMNELNLNQSDGLLSQDIATIYSDGSVLISATHGEKRFSKLFEKAKC